jgi:hypothetical protein
MTTYEPAYQLEWHNGSQFVSIDNDFVLGIDLDIETDGDENNPFFLGDQSEAAAQIKLRSVASFYNQAWEDRRIRVRQKMMGTTLRTVFEGIINHRRAGAAADTITFGCAGYGDLIRRSKAVSDLYYRRRGATETTTAVWDTNKSVDDPANPNYAAGLINYALWVAGGRPLELDYLYPSARFYYSCDNSLFIPEWTWLAGEDTWAECAEIARTCGGQMYQADNGVIHFRSPFTPTQGLVSLTWDEGDYADLEEDIGTSVKADRVKVPWSLRAIQPPGVAFDLAQPVIVPAKGASTYGTLDLPIFTPELPIWRWDDLSGTPPTATLSGLSSENLVVSDFSNVRIKPTGGQAVFMQAREIGAQWLQLRLHHTYNKPIVFNRIVLNATPIAVVATGEVVVGNGSSQFNFDPSPYISSEPHARQLGEMLLAFYNKPRPVRRVKGLIYDEWRYQGERVRLSNSDFGISNEVHCIVGLHPRNGNTMDADVIPVGDLPQYDQLFVIGETYASSAVRQVVF